MFCKSGLIRQMNEKDFLTLANKEPYVVLNFIHAGFPRTSLLNDHLKRIAKEQRNTVSKQQQQEKCRGLSNLRKITHPQLKKT